MSSAVASIFRRLHPGWWVRAALVLLACLWWLPLCAQETPAPPRTRTANLPPGEYLWMPEVAPRGPVVIVVSLPEQLAYVYRNGARIGVSTVSTGRPGYETPTGIFSILQKHREHYSNLYDDAPMPFMQRLSWSGVALHAGNIPGHPASHGCIRLPYAFAEKLFGITSRGMTVVVASENADPPHVAYPGLFTPVDPVSGLPRADYRADYAASPETEFTWTPYLAPDGPLTVILSTLDHEVVVMRNAVEIGRSTVELRGDPLAGTQVYVLLEGTGPGTSAVVPDRPALRWLAVPVADARDPAAGDLRQAVAAGQLSVPVEFARRVYDALAVGATLVVTDDSIRARGDAPGMTVLDADRSVDPSPPADTP
jgi:hypothetical protein